MTQGDKTLAAVRRYIELGWVVHPCCPPSHSCDCPGKIPYDPVGGHHMGAWQDHTQFTLEQWKYFVECEPHINVGVLCGSPSGILLIDIDNEEAMNEYRRLEGESPEGQRGKAWRFATGNGERFIFLRGDRSESFKIPTGTGHFVEVLGDGRQSVVPPSVHPTGRKYHWIDKFTPRNFRASGPPDSFVISGGGSADSGGGELDSEREDWVRTLSRGIQEGNRNNEMTRLCGHLMAPHPMSESEAWWWFNLYNDNCVTPPMPESELRKIFNSIKKREESGASRILEIMAEYNVSKKQAMVYMEAWGENG